MNKEQAWKAYWDGLSRFDRIGLEPFRKIVEQAFEAGHDSARREDAEACEIIDMAAKYYTSQIHEMRLCEASRVFLKPNVGYFFTVDPNCEVCVDADVYNNVQS